MDYANIYGNTSLNVPSSDGWKGTENVPTDADTGESSERKRPFKKLFGGLRDKLGSMFGKEFDSSDFDVQDPKQVLKLQKELGVEQDGVYGPITKEAHQEMVDNQRLSKGLDAYDYGDGTDVDEYGDRESRPMDGPLQAAIDEDEGFSYPSKGHGALY